MGLGPLAAAPKIVNKKPLVRNLFLFQLVMRRKRSRGEPGVRGKTERKGQDLMYYLHDSMLLVRYRQRQTAIALTIPHGIPLWVLACLH